jgi:hypothetical protein
VLRRLISGNTRLAERFRDGRVLLVGDAAHLYTGGGAPGLNLGLQDTINLGWKLAAELRGDAPLDLLDSYQAERQPVARRMLMYSQAQSALMAPGSDVTALRELFTELLGDPSTVQRLADLIAGSDVRYDMGVPNAHPLVGQLAPDLDLDTPTGTVRLAELTRIARPLLLDLTEGAVLAELLAEWRDRVDIVAARSPTPALSATALLLRPDSYVAWATAVPHPDATDQDSLRAALHRWFGVPSPVHAR